MIRSPPDFLRRVRFNGLHPRTTLGSSQDSRGLESRGHSTEKALVFGLRNRKLHPLYCNPNFKKFSYHQQPSSELLHTPFCTEGLKKHNISHSRITTGIQSNNANDIDYSEHTYANLIYRNKASSCNLHTNRVHHRKTSADNSHAYRVHRIKTATDNSHGKRIHRSKAFIDISRIDSSIEEAPTEDVHTNLIYRNRATTDDPAKECSVKTLINKYNAISCEDSDKIINSINSHASVRNRIPSFLDYKSRETPKVNHSDPENIESFGLNFESSCTSNANTDKLYTPSVFDSHLSNTDDLEDLRGHTRRIRRSESSGRFYKRRSWKTLRRKVTSFFISSRTKTSERRAWKSVRRKVASLFISVRPRTTEVIWQFAPKASRTEYEDLFRQSLQGTYIKKKGSFNAMWNNGVFVATKSAMLEDRMLGNSMGTCPYDRFQSELGEDLLPDVSEPTCVKEREKGKGKKGDTFLADIGTRLHKKFLAKKGQSYSTGLGGYVNKNFDFRSETAKVSLHSIAIGTSPYDMFHYMEDENGLSGCNDSFESFLKETYRIKQYDKVMWRPEDTFGYLV